MTEKIRSKITATEMRFLRKVERIIRRDKIMNETVIDKLNMKLVIEVLDEKQLRCLGHLYRMACGGISKEIYKSRIQRKKKIGRP